MTYRVCSILTYFSDFGCTAFEDLSITCMSNFKIGKLTVINRIFLVDFWVNLVQKVDTLRTFCFYKFLVTQLSTCFIVGINKRQEHLKLRTHASPWCHFIMIQLAGPFSVIQLAPGCWENLCQPVVPASDLVFVREWCVCRSLVQFYMNGHAQAWPHQMKKKIVRQSKLS